jgi:FMN phosphatase YigB (HAD superfamily)
VLHRHPTTGPAIFPSAAQAPDREPRECLFVGDSYETDVVGAKPTGLVTFWYNPRRLAPPRSDIRPDLTIQAQEELLEILALTGRGVPAKLPCGGVSAMASER